MTPPADGLCVRYRLVLFDFDGTLADSLPWLRGVLPGVAERFGFDGTSDEELERLRGLPPGEILARMGLPARKVPRVATHLRARMAEEASRISLFPWVPDLLRRLSEVGVTLGLVSSNRAGTVRRILGDENASRIAHFACGTSLFGKHRHFRRVLAASGVPAEAALAVGDEVRDLQAARAAGIDFGAVAWGYGGAEAFRTYDLVEVFHDPDALLSRILG